MQKIIIVETNEIPLRLFKLYAQRYTSSTISKLLNDSLVLETVVKDVDYDFLYPSQTWASMNTGAPYNLHKIHWYNDPKPVDYPMYWRRLADSGHSVGLVNTLHSSPAAVFSKSEQYRFVIPDCFAIDDYAKPNYYRSFQAINLKLTAENARVTSLRVPLNEALSTFLDVFRYGIRASTALSASLMLTKIFTKRANKERLRTLQFPLLADMFIKQIKRHQPSLSVLFTNHVAANMHRYWYALFPEDYPVKVYSDAWVAKYSQEIIDALILLDSYLAKLVDIAQTNKSILILASSMGQHGNTRLPASIDKLVTFDFQLVDVNRFFNHLMQTVTSYRVEAGMAPQYSLRFAQESDAQAAYTDILASQKSAEGVIIKADLNAETVTLTVSLQREAARFALRGKAFSIEEMGFKKIAVEDHHSGCHFPQGSLIIFNSNTSASTKPSVNYLEYAPAILKHFGIDRDAYMEPPSFVI
jgi:hypothetical protein